MFWIVVLIAVVLLLLAFAPRVLGRLLIVLSVLWLVFAFWVKGGDPDPGFAFLPPMILWGGVFVTAWIARA